MIRFIAKLYQVCEFVVDFKQMEEYKVNKKSSYFSMLKYIGFHTDLHIFPL
jgi:hypothetical protein